MAVNQADSTAKDPGAAQRLKVGSKPGDAPVPGWRTAAAAIAACLLAVMPGISSGVRAQERQWSPEQQAVIDAVRHGPLGIEVDFEGWASGYAKEWTYWRVGDPVTRPRDEHMALVRDFIDAGNRPTAFDLQPVDVIIRGDVALLRLIATEELREGPHAADGGVRTVRYASAAMLTRVEGQWKMLATNIVYLD